MLQQVQCYNVIVPLSSCVDAPIEFAHVALSNQDWHVGHKQLVFIIGAQYNENEYYNVPFKKESTSPIWCAQHTKRAYASSQAYPKTSTKHAH